ncbi:MAG: NAD(P)-binding protein [Xanthobacteraceae bacterium]
MRAEGQGGLTPASRRIVVAGAGIAGLTAAIALAKRRFDVTLHRSRAAPGRDRCGPATFAQCEPHPHRAGAGAAPRRAGDRACRHPHHARP